MPYIQKEGKIIKIDLETLCDLIEFKVSTKLLRGVVQVADTFICFSGELSG